MIEKQLLAALENLKIIRVKTVGEKFDPNLHNAVMLVEDPNVESGTIVEELEAGYMYEDKVMRFSSVIVAK
jgi:molecular chaperone GrpE